jgi:hypothetical protein
MGGYSRTQNIQYRMWAPPESRVRIEYSTDVLKQLRRDSANMDVGGILFGLRNGNELRVSAARSMKADVLESNDPLLAGLDAVGIFIARPRGEVFLTESDLKRFEQVDVPDGVALVVAGSRAGFFLREAGGSIQSIRSYREFSLAEDSSRSTPLAKPTPPGQFIPAYAWILLGCFALLVVSILARSVWTWSHPQPPLDLAVHLVAGQLRIGWNPAVATKPARLEIRDGVRKTTIPITAPLANATYAPQTGDVEVRLLVSDGSAPPRSEIVRFLGYSRGLQ